MDNFDAAFNVCFVSICFQSKIFVLYFTGCIIPICVVQIIVVDFLPELKRGLINEYYSEFKKVLLCQFFKMHHFMPEYV